MAFSLHSPKSFVHFLTRFAILLLIFIAALAASAHWPNANATKWVQFPDPKGLDVLAAQPPSAQSQLSLILADDFPCQKPGPITDIHIWASWLGDNPDPTVPITLSIWSDVPRQGTTPSHPGSMLWSQKFLPTQYTVKAVQTANEQFWDPEPPPKGTILGPDHIIYQYNFYPPNPFIQEGTAANPITYWLAVSAGTNTSLFGWKTTTNHWNDDAVWGHIQPDGVTPIGDWLDMHDPRDTSANPQSLDLSFALTTTETPPPPPQPPNKWVQYPDTNGFDVNATSPNIIADDFWCTNAGVLTNIQIWGSWQDDAPPNPNTVFVLGIWSDVPGGPTTGNIPYSHPGQLLWTETFTPGNYGVASAGSGIEFFYSPTTGQLIPETKIYLYNFNPKNPFCQRGTPNSPIIYWLSVRAVLPNNGIPFGWKTSTNHWKDDAVYGHLTATTGPSMVTDWKDLHDPRSGANGLSLDMAFRINNGPPTPNCDPTIRPKWVQWPDVTPNGLDVHATFPRVVGDDFLCKVTGPISGITVWGSWLNDLVDTNATFQLNLWTDAPTGPGNTFSHPGQLLCSTVFNPPQTVGTSVQRYKYHLAADKLQENFYDSDLPSFTGTDTQIWQYDFYPFYSQFATCWFQRGGDATFAGGLTYWVTLSCFPADQSKLFGWKTATNHWNDDAVWGHLDAAHSPLKDWKDLHDPRTGISLDLSFALKNFPITGKNEDVKNTTSSTATGLQIVVAGIHEVTWHYDDAPAWPNFDVTFAGGNTILTWSGKTVGVGVVSHVGFEMGGSGAPPIISQNWLGPGGIIGPAYQLNYHLLGNATTGGQVLVLNNDITGLPIAPANGSVEFYRDPPPLDQMVVSGNRIPLATMPLLLPAVQIPPGSLMRVAIPPGPPSSMYALMVMNLMDGQGQFQGMDFVLMPLDMALRPIIHGADLLPGSLNLRWFSIPDRSYHIEMRAGLVPASDWTVVPLPDLNGDGDELSVPVPIGSGQGLYRVVLDPQ